MTREVKEEVERMLRAGERHKAIEYLQATFGISVEDAVILVEALEREIGLAGAHPATPSVQTATRLQGSIKAEVAELLKAGQHREAVQLVRKKQNVGFLLAVASVEEVAKELNPSYVAINPMGCLQTLAKGVGVFVMIVSLMFLAGAAIVYFIQWQSIGSSDRVTGTVIEMKSLDSGESAPVVEFEWQGKTRSYMSKYYSSPPDYYVGQTVPVLVNREVPDEITLDTFEDRWALIVGLCVIGGVLLAISIVFLKFSRRKF